MSKRRSSIPSLLLFSGFILILIGAVSAVAASAPPDAFVPANYGDVAPPTPLRPTVTPLPGPGQIPPPLELPSTPLEAPTPIPIAIAPAEPTRDPGPQTPRRIVIAAIGLDAPIETVGWHVINGVSTWDVPDHRAAGWLKTSAPLGQAGNTVLDGHHNIAGEVFRDLVNLKPGDVIEVHSSQQVYTYKVTTRQTLRELGQPDEVRMKNAQWIAPTEDERLTLVTCWPYTSNSHRLIVVAKPSAPGAADIRP